MAKSEGRKWFVRGCLGCLGLVVLVVVISASIVGVAMLKARNQEIEDKVLTPELPAAAPVDREQLRQLPEGVGRFVLDLRNSGFRLEPAAEGEPLQVEANYDSNTFVLEETLETGGTDPAWTYRLGFRPKGSPTIAALAALFSGNQPELHIWLPLDVPMDVELKINSGGGDAELGGLWMRSLAIDFQKGGGDVRISEPTREPLERLSVVASMGGLSTSRLGNASPAELVFDFGMGGGDLDLRGEWVRDSQVTIGVRMGGASVRLPRDVVIEGLDRGGIDLEPDAEVRPPTLTFSVSTGMGAEIEFID